MSCCLIMITAIKQHQIEVKKISQIMKSFFAKGEKVRIYHGSTNSTRSLKFEKDKLVDISQLNHVIKINTAEKYTLVEPNVPMDELVDETLRYGLVPPVVMEFPGITVGGGIQGGAGESSSFKYGLFHNTCLEYEIILGNGKLVTASPTKNRDLFYGTSCSYGSLGIITRVKLRLVPAKNFVHLKYSRVKSFKEAVTEIKKKIKEPNDFVDGIIFAKDEGVIMSGNFTELNNLPVSTFSKPTDEWFYLHADKIAKKFDHYEEIVPTKDYLFRYDRGSFWAGKYAFTLLNIPYFRLIRTLLNPIFKTRRLFRFLHSTNISQTYFAQDLSLPRENVLKFLRFIDKTMPIYPLWLCPLRPDKSVRFSSNYLATNLVINVGTWGQFIGNYLDFVKINRSVENIVTQFKGRKVLYAHAYYSRHEFWKIFDHRWYCRLRNKYFGESVFLDIYDKTKVTEKYHPSLFRGIIKAFFQPRLPIT